MYDLCNILIYGRAIFLLDMREVFPPSLFDRNTTFKDLEAKVDLGYKDLT